MYSVAFTNYTVYDIIVNPYKQKGIRSIVTKCSWSQLVSTPFLFLAMIGEQGPYLS